MTTRGTDESGLSTPVRELWPAGLHPWLERLVLALILVLTANCGIGLGIAGYELAELLYWAFAGLLTVTTMTTINLAKLHPENLNDTDECFTNGRGVACQELACPAMALSFRRGSAQYGEMHDSFTMQ